MRSSPKATSETTDAIPISLCLTLPHVHVCSLHDIFVRRSETTTASGLSTFHFELEQLRLVMGTRNEKQVAALSVASLSAGMAASQHLSTGSSLSSHVEDTSEAQSRLSALADDAARSLTPALFFYTDAEDIQVSFSWSIKGAGLNSTATLSTNRTNFKLLCSTPELMMSSLAPWMKEFEEIQEPRARFAELVVNDKYRSFMFLADESCHFLKVSFLFEIVLV